MGNYEAPQDRAPTAEELWLALGLDLVATPRVEALDPGSTFPLVLANTTYTVLPDRTTGPPRLLGTISNEHPTAMLYLNRGTGATVLLGEPIYPGTTARITDYTGPVTVASDTPNVTVGRSET